VHIPAPFDAPGTLRLIDVAGQIRVYRAATYRIRIVGAIVQRGQQRSGVRVPGASNSAFAGAVSTMRLKNITATRSQM
jgi:hypothetical protein